MSNRRRKKVNLGIQDEPTFDVDMSPMLSLMVVLIPIMLLSTVFVRISLIETPLPQVVQNAIEEDKNKKDKKIQLVLTMESPGFKLEILQDGRSLRSDRIPNVNNKWDISSLYKMAHATKLNHPDVFHLDFKPSSNVKYEDMVKVMDTLRKINKEDQKAILIDKDTKQKVETDVMFPEINLANVIEG